MGTRFSSSKNGYIRRLRFWKAPGESGTNTLRLYTESGVELASTSCGSSGGWCTGILASPGVAVTAGTNYRVTVNTNVKQSKTDLVFCGTGAGISNGPLTANNGYWIAGHAFPTNQSCSNFFVDALFDM